MIVVVMGVSGSGKSTVGKLLAQQLGWTFVEGDDFHPPANVEKMRRGVPLNDDDRHPWLEAIHRRLEAALQRDENIILACSALKHAYQHYFGQFASHSVGYVYLSGSEELIRSRLASRTNHFMNPSLLHSQFQALEPPEDALQLDIAASPESLVETIRQKLAI